MKIKVYIDQRDFNRLKKLKKSKGQDCVILTVWKYPLAVEESIKISIQEETNARARTRKH